MWLPHQREKFVPMCKCSYCERVHMVNLPRCVNGAINLVKYIGLQSVDQVH